MKWIIRCVRPNKPTIDEYSGNNPSDVAIKWLKDNQKLIYPYHEEAILIIHNKDFHLLDRLCVVWIEKKNECITYNVIESISVSSKTIQIKGTKDQ